MNRSGKAKYRMITAYTKSMETLGEKQPKIWTTLT